MSFSNVPPPDEGGQGDRARRSGALSLAQVEALLQKVGMHLDPRSRTIEEFRLMGTNCLFGGGFYAKGIVAGLCSYKRPLRVPFAIWRPEWKQPILLDVMGQDGTGTADEKIVKAARDLAKCSQCQSILLLTGRHLEGDTGIHECVREFISISKHKTLLRLFVGGAEFQRWVVEGMPYPTISQLTI